MIRLFDWIPAGVYPGENRGRNDEIHKLALMPPRGEGRPFIPPAEPGGILAYFDKVENETIPLPLERLCRKSVHGSTGPVLSKPFIPSRASGRTVNCNTVSDGGG
jgi:hypothetical protein